MEFGVEAVSKLALLLNLILRWGLHSRSDKMKTIAIAITFMGMTLASAPYAGAACAQATRTCVSGVGGESNPCSRTVRAKPRPALPVRTILVGLAR